MGTIKENEEPLFAQYQRQTTNLFWGDNLGILLDFILLDLRQAGNVKRGIKRVSKFKDQTVEKQTNFLYYRIWIINLYSNYVYVCIMHE